MEVFAVLFGVLIFVGGPAALLVTAVLALRRAGRAEARVAMLEGEVDGLRLRVDALAAGRALGGSANAAPTGPAIAAPPVPAPAVPVPDETSPARDTLTTAPGPARPAPAPLPIAPPTTRDTGEPARPAPGTAAPPPGEADPLVDALLAPAPPPRPRLSPERAATWLAAGLGGLSLLVAAGFAVAVAVDRGWMGPGIRAGAGLVLSTGLWLAAEPLRRRRLPQVAAALAGAGVGGLYSVLWATHGLWHLVSSLVAFGLMAAVAAVATLQAHRRGDRFAAALGVVGALLTPVLVSTGQNRPYALFGYLCLVGLGAAVPAARRGWAGVLALVGLGSAGLFLGYTGRHHLPQSRPGALLGVALLLVPMVLAVLRARPDDRRVGLVSRAFVLGLPLLALPWLGSIDAWFSDPRTGMVAFFAPPEAPWLVLGAALLLPLPAVVLARRGPDPTAGIGPAAVVLALVGAALEGFSGAPSPAVLPLSLLLLVPGLAALGLAARHRGPGLGGALGAFIALCGTAALGGSLVEQLAQPGPLWATTAAALVAGLGTAATWPPLLLAALAAAALPLAVGADSGVSATTLAALGVLSLAGLGVLPLTQGRWRRGAGAVAAALAGPALFPALWVAWDQGPLAAVPGLLPVGLGAVSLLGATVLIRRERVQPASGRLAALVGAALLGAVAAVPLQLEDGWLTVAWALEAAAVAAVALRLSHPLLRWAPVVLGAAVAVRLCVNPAALDYGDAAGLPVLNWTLWTWGIPALALALAGALQRRATPPDAWTGRRAALLGILAIAVGFALVNVQVAHAFRDAGPLELHESGLLEGMVRSIAWAVYGLFVLGLGIRLERGPLRLLGFLLMLLAAGKVFAVDLWSLEGFVRVGSVLGLGVTLLVSAWLFERVVRRGAGAAEES